MYQPWMPRSPRTTAVVRPFVAWLAVTLLAVAAGAQGPARPKKAGDPLKRHLFPAELVMSHQSEIGLDDTQRQAVIAEIQAMQSDIVPWEFAMREAVEELARLLAEPAVDEDAVLGLAERVTGLEAKIKQRHLRLLIRIKNLLSAEQQSRLRALRRE